MCLRCMAAQQGGILRSKSRGENITIRQNLGGNGAEIARCEGLLTIGQKILRGLLSMPMDDRDQQGGGRGRNELQRLVGSSMEREGVEESGRYASEGVGRR